VFRDIRDRWAGRITLQAAALVPMEIYDREEGLMLADLVAGAGGILGGIARRIEHDADPALLDAQLDRLLRFAAERGLDVDLHVDESGDPESRALAQVARAVLRNRYRGKVNCGHCCSLAVQPEDAANEAIALAREANLSVVSLPMVNLFLQGRLANRTPRWRGVTLLRELLAAGLPVSVASDNCRDPYFAFGDLDMLEVFREAVRIAHLDFDFAAWPAAVTRTPADVMSLAELGILRMGAPADLVLFRGRSMSELLARPQSDRIILRGGRRIEAVPPDYRELDSLLRTGSA
jgi:cytosine deaminase